MSRVDTAAVRRAWPLAATLVRRYGVGLRPDGGRRLRARCPLPGHERDREPSFVVYADQNSFFCFGWGRGGDVITLVAAIERVDFRGAVARLTDGRLPLVRPATMLRPGHRPVCRPAAPEPADRAVLALAVDLYARRLAGDAGALAYLRSRGLDDATITRRRLGLAGGLTAELTRRRLPRAPFVWTGLLCADGRERLAGRVVVPEVVAGQPTWLTGRSLPDRLPDRPDAPRYVALPGPRPLVGLGVVSPDPPWVLVVEGVFDALLLDAWGLPAVALGGVTCPPALVAALARFSRLVLLLDRDPAGERATAALQTALGDRAVAATLPAGVKDASDLAAWPDGRARLLAALADAGVII
ncbi:MAG: toprim domain-containing protein [Chloroflexi bacterium]|nr:toprim domain-containing protein [Chloroflexota bacterium]